MLHIMFSNGNIRFFKSEVQQMTHEMSTEERRAKSWEADRESLGAACRRLKKGLEDLPYIIPPTPEQQALRDQQYQEALKSMREVSGAELLALVNVAEHALGLHWAYGKKMERSAKDGARARLFMAIEEGGRLIQEHAAMEQK